MPLRQIDLPGQRSRAQELYTWLRSAISSGELQPHERLVETVVADLANVSRTPVREALHRLAVDGLVHESEGGGMEVRGFTLEGLADLCAVRETLEGMASRLAATSRSDMDVSVLEHVLGQEIAALDADDAAVQVELNHAFHETLWNASRNRYLVGQLRNLREMIEQLQDTTLGHLDRRRAAIAEHQALVQAVAVRDADLAELITRRHFRNAMAARLVPGGPALHARDWRTAPSRPAPDGLDGHREADPDYEVQPG